LSLLYYRDWAERNAALTQADKVAEEIAVDTDTKAALSCPKCNRLMTKYSVSGEHSNRLDLCGSCDEVWLDGGEWPLLISLELTHELPAVFTGQWQKKVRDQKIGNYENREAEKLVGDSDAIKALEIKEWLLRHTQKGVIVQFISSD